MQPERVLTVCAFTGHRPSGFIFKYDETHPACVGLKQIIKKQIELLYKRGVKNFCTGCALGVDMWAGEAVLSLKKQYADMELYCVVPFKGQEAQWKYQQRKRYHKLLKKSNGVIVLNEAYTNDCYFERNRYLIDHADVLLAVYNGKTNKESGTGYTISYAKQRDKTILLIDPDTFKRYTFIPRDLS